MTQDLAPVVPTELPELPEGELAWVGDGSEPQGARVIFTADKMRAYARAALADHPQQGVPTDEDILRAWEAWPKTAITSRRHAIEFYRSVQVGIGERSKG